MSMDLRFKDKNEFNKFYDDFIKEKKSNPKKDYCYYWGKKIGEDSSREKIYDLEMKIIELESQIRTLMNN